MRVLVLCALLACARASRLVRTAQGPMRARRHDSFDGYVFYNVPYASAPTGRDRFKEPGPPPVWSEPYDADDEQVLCPQPDASSQIMAVPGTAKEDCLIANIYVPDVEEVLPVVLYVHGGGFIVGRGDMMEMEKMAASKKAIYVTFNYRLAGHGFLCLGTEDIPGNAGMKDQVAMLRWIQKNIASFGGNPNDVTIIGSSAGSASVDLLILSKRAKGLFHKVVPESGANTAAFSVQTDPIRSSMEYAQMLNYTGTDDIYELEEFFLSLPLEVLNSVYHFSRTDATAIISPCVERDTGKEVFLHDSPVNILKSGDYQKLPMLYGFTNMESLMGLMSSKDIKSTLRHMDENFSDYLPRDLQFATPKEKEEVANKIKKYFFGDRIDEEDILDYVNYHSDVFFIYSTLRSVKLQVEAGNNEIYLYEYSFTDGTTPFVPFTKVRGANHCAQSVAIWELPLFEVNETDEYQAMANTLREMWTNFITTGKPVPEGSSLPAWPPVGSSWAPHMALGRAVELRGSLLKERAQFWEEIYAQHYRAPQPPPPPPSRRTEL